LLLSGSLRDNIDPFNEYSDEVIWEALRKVQLKDYFLKYAEKVMLDKSDEKKYISTETRNHGVAFSFDNAAAAADYDDNDNSSSNSSSSSSSSSSSNGGNRGGSGPSKSDNLRYSSVLDNDKIITDNGGSLSVGQRQLLCLARILVRSASGSANSRIIVLGRVHW
jgi:ABC-type multidrug transport system fused ATPase/permease subunit